jgi:hypothetical protein
VPINAGTGKEDVREDTVPRRECTAASRSRVRVAVICLSLGETESEYIAGGSEAARRC